MLTIGIERRTICNRKERTCMEIKMVKNDSYAIFFFMIHNGAAVRWKKIIYQIAECEHQRIPIIGLLYRTCVKLIAICGIIVKSMTYISSYR